LDENRPDPDALLKRLQVDEERRRQGQLKIFFGYSPGVGKTYAMLEAARARQAEGKVVCAGIVETHRRPETEALMAGLPALPRRVYEYRGVDIPEFDLDGAISQKPGLLLVDELAHTNAPGSRHAKRWQDVLELLDRGIDVYTTMNVQHLESLNDIVAQITGIQVRETVPRSVIDRAAEMELVDLPPDELLKRLAEGKVYRPQQAGQAADNFFKKDNLTALREMSLRLTADRVNDEVEIFRRGKASGKTWAVREKLLVCVGPSPNSIRLIRSAHRMARSLRAGWIAVYVETGRPWGLSAQDRNRLLDNLRLAERLGGETVTLSGQDFITEVLNFARARNITKILVGKPTDPFWRKWFLPSPVDGLIRRSGEIDVYVIQGDSDQPKVRVSAPPSRPTPWSQYLYASLVVIGCTLAAALMHQRFSPANIIMIYLLGVAIVAGSTGRKGPSAAACVASVVLFDVLFVPPRLSLAVTDTQYLVTFGVMLGVALAISELTLRVRMQAEAARLRERRTSALYSLSRDLATRQDVEDLLHVAVTHIAEIFESRVVALLPDGKGHLEIRAGLKAEFAMNPKEQSVAQWVFDLGQVAGRGTDTLPGAEALYVPLQATGGPVGVLGVRPDDPERLLLPEQLHLLEAFANQTALALEYERIARENQESKVRFEAEQLRNSLLSALSHDLRTPLAAITGSAESLLESGSEVRSKESQELVQNIANEASRLERLVSNLLEMTKLQSGNVELKKALQPLEEVVGSALERLTKTLSGREVRANIPPDLPMVPLDSLLMEQVFINLLENAAKYSPASTPIDITARLQNGTLSVEVADRGQGIQEGEEDRIFDKFYRGKGTQRQGGVGLGLTICRGIVEAHGGKISAGNREGGGSVFTLTLPLGTSTPGDEA